MPDFFDLDADEQSRRLGILAINALKEWGITDCQPRLIKYRENAVFEVQTTDNKRAAMRVHRQGYHTQASLESEVLWMNMLAQGGLSVPTPIATLSGDYLVKGSADGVPGVWMVDMLDWLEGRELGDIGEPLDYEGRDPRQIIP